MGDRFYMQQQSRSKSTSAKPPRKLKKDYIAEIDKLLGRNISGLDKCTIATLGELIDGIENLQVH